MQISVQTPAAAAEKIIAVAPAAVMLLSDWLRAACWSPPSTERAVLSSPPLSASCAVDPLATGATSTDGLPG
jgi:hypothetical protein